MKLSLEKGILNIFPSMKPPLKIGILLVIGLLLILLSGLFGEKPAKEQTEEQRVAEMCSLMEGVGECRVMMTYEKDSADEVYAVLVLCDGGESVAVREKITSLLCSLYGIGSHRVEIQRLCE